MIERLPIPVRFKGRRDYVHGSDLHDALCSVAATAGFFDIRKIDLTFHKIVREGLDAQVVERTAAGAVPSDAAAVFQFHADGQARAVYLIPNGRPVIAREPCPEEQIVEVCHFDLGDQDVTVSSPIPFTNIEILIAMNKALLQKLFPDAAGKWYFTRLLLSETVWNRKFETLRIRLEANLNFLITRSAILADGAPLGHIFFSLVQ